MNDIWTYISVFTGAIIVGMAIALWRLSGTEPVTRVPRRRR
ncbi:hypothetical protein [Actomonas aquatica]|uniref:Uncharacterized protein n=1 Tax=Actomonas aquatica TaxID=2866162 RepID=A0ABZ1C9Z4_9BACT|nr:hypothetical protein [Opitutus sp. WL0086]WRQ88323.1 hypothetical protein K1X11_002830 [Opitutus sp. WL0086]